MPNHEERYLGHIRIDVSFKYERDYWDQQITAHAIVSGPDIAVPLHVRKSTGCMDVSSANYNLRCKHELDSMWSMLIYTIKRRLEEGGNSPSFPAIEHENEEKPCPFQAKD